MPTQSSRKCWLCLASVVAMSTASLAVAGEPKTEQRTGRTATFRDLALQQFDANENGRLDAKEQSAATQALLAKESKDSSRQLLREKAIAEFDANDNGKLERQEIRTALRSVNGKSTTAGRGSNLRSVFPRFDAATRAPKQAAKRDPQLAQTVQLTIMRLGATDAETAAEFAYATFDVNGDGNLDQAELAAARATLQQYAQMQSAQLASQLTLGATALGSSGGTTSGTSTSGSQSGGASGMCGGGSTGSTSQSVANGRALSSSSAFFPGMIGSNAVGGFGGGFGGGQGGGGFGGGFHGGRGR